MVSAANWLDELGIPPREVCLDWAWQLQTHFAETRSTVCGEPADLLWQRIEVRPNGELLLPANTQDYSPAARLRELLSWAQSENTTIPYNAEPVANGDWNDLGETLCRLTASYVRGSVEQTQQVAASPDTFLPSTASDTSDTIMPFVGQLKGQRHAKNRKKNSRSSSQSIDQIFVAIKQHKLAASLLSAGLALVCIVAVYYRMGNIGRREVGTSKTVALSRDEEAIPAERNAKNTSPDLDDANVLATIPEMPQLEVTEPEVGEVAPVVMPSIPSSRITGIGPKPLDSSAAASKPEDTELTGVVQTEQGTSVTGSPLTSPDATELQNRDVMQELDALTKSAANNAGESDLKVPDAMDSSTHPESANLEPLMLSTSPMIQTQKIASKIKVRPRQPVWQIRLSVDDEFELTPSEQQDVSDRQVTTWFLFDSDAKSPIVRLVIQAQAVPGRQAALRWRVFASAEDLPDLALPLDKELLNPLQDRLRLYSQMSQREADRLKQLAGGVDRDLRAAMTRQRVNLESQSKLASRVSAVVAESRLLDDLLRGQLTVHAKLLDGVGSNAPPLLQFGDPSKVEQVPAETKPLETVD